MCVGRESSLNNLQNQSKPIFVSTMCVCAKKGRCREVVFFSADLYIFLEGDDCDDDL